jgi:hypothetical protein
VRSLQGMLLVGGGNILPYFYINLKVGFCKSGPGLSTKAAPPCTGEAAGAPGMNRKWAPLEPIYLKLP